MHLRKIFAVLAAGALIAAVSAFPASAESQRYYGLYRGTVFHNVDPLQKGRLQLLVPDVSGTQPTSWALPVLPYPYKVSSLKLPKIGQGVWVEFEEGNPDFPVWIGGRPQ